MRLLGDLSANEFLSKFWQQELLLIRGALPDYCSPVSADELAGLALEPVSYTHLTLPTILLV